MSAPSCLVFYGLSVRVEVSEVDAIERRTDPRIAKARKAQLKHYFGRFMVNNQAQHLLLVGRKIGEIGVEGEMAVMVDRRALEELMTEVGERLRAAGWAGEPSLHALHESD
ncbi:MAG: hypothetical protein U0228_27370 [Myxococcaceae bacterium]